MSDENKPREWMMRVADSGVHITVQSGPAITEPTKVIEHSAYTHLEAKLTRAREYHESYLKLKYGDDIEEMLQEYDAYVAGET